MVARRKHLARNNEVLTALSRMTPAAARQLGDSLSEGEAGVLDGVTAGTVAASKAVVVDSNKDASAFRNVGVVNLDAGSSGVAGTVDVFPSTASKGKLQIAVTDQTGNTTVAVQIGAMAAARAITLADPGATANILTDVGIGGTQIARASAQFDATSGTTGTTLTNVTGMVLTVIPATYKYRVCLPGVATANSGIKAAFKLTTTVLTSIEATGLAYTASAVAVQHTTTTTDQTAQIGSTSAAIYTVLEGSMVVGTGGTIQIQAAQNASHADTTSVYAGATFELTRIA